MAAIAKFQEEPSPAVLWLSESGNKVVVRDDAIANAIGRAIEPGKNLPDLVMADLGPRALDPVRGSGGNRWRVSPLGKVTWTPTA